jgi:hypothetical protein
MAVVECRTLYMKDRTHYLVSISKGVASTLVACLISGAVPLRAAGAGAKPAVDPRADEMLKRMSDYLAQAQFFSINAEIWQDIKLSSGQWIQAGRTLQLRIRRPDRWHAEVHSPYRNRELFYDGKTITLFNRAEKLYGVVPAPTTLDEALDVASDRFGIVMPLEDFLRSDPRKDLLQQVTSGTDIGAVDVMGVPCEHLAFSQTNIDWQLWIDKGPMPVPRKFVITYKDDPDSPEFNAIFVKWDFTTKLPDFVFQFEPPADAFRIKVKELEAINQPHPKEVK